MLIIYIVFIVLKTKSVGEEENNAYNKYLCYLGNLFISSASTKLKKGQSSLVKRSFRSELHVGFAIKLNI